MRKLLLTVGFLALALGPALDRPGHRRGRPGRRTGFVIHARSSRPAMARRSTAIGLIFIWQSQR